MSRVFEARDTSRSALVNVSRDDRGIATAEPKANSGRRGLLLASYLMIDGQGDPYAVSEMLDWPSNVESCEVKKMENDGSSFNLIVQPEGESIENLVIEELPEE